MDRVFQALCKERSVASSYMEEESQCGEMNHRILPAGLSIYSKNGPLASKPSGYSNGYLARCSVTHDKHSPDYDADNKRKSVPKTTSNMNLPVGQSASTTTLKTKIVLTGDVGVGKTTLFEIFESSQNTVTSGHVKRLTHFNPELTWVQDHVNERRIVQRKSCCKVELQRDNGHITMTVCDTAGQERYRSITASYYRGAHGCLLLFDVTKASTFESLSTWHNDLTCYSTNPDMISVILVGTTCQSKDREIPKEKAEKFAEHLGIPYREINTQDVHDAKKLFEELSDMIIENYMKHPSFLDGVTTSTANIGKTKRKSWCSC